MTTPEAQTRAPAPALQNRSMSGSTWMMLGILGLIWGGSFFFGRVAVAEVPPFTLVLLRVLIAAVALHLVFLSRPGFHAALAARWRELVILGILNNVIPFTLIVLGQTAIGAGLASILNATTPVWTMLVAQAATTDEKLNRAKVVGAALGLAGTVVLIGPAALGVDDSPLWAKLAILGAAISYGCSGTYAKRFRGQAPEVTATGQLTASSVILLPIALLVDAPWALPLPSLPVIGAVLGLSLLSTAFAYLLFFRVLATAGATGASLVTLLVPPSAILLGILFLNESLTIGEVAGMALIALGLLSLDNRLAITRGGPRTR